MFCCNKQVQKWNTVLEFVVLGFPRVLSTVISFSFRFVALLIILEGGRDNSYVKKHAFLNKDFDKLYKAITISSLLIVIQATPVTTGIVLSIVWSFQHCNNGFCLKNVTKC